MKNVVTISLGSSKQDFERTINFLGHQFTIKRMAPTWTRGKPGS